MENPEFAPSIPAPAPFSAKKENELTESRQEVLSRIQNLKQDLQNWRMKLDTQVKVYRDELSELKSSLNTEVEQLRNQFQELRTTLQQQQEDVTASLKDLGDDSGEIKGTEDSKDTENIKAMAQDLSKEDIGKESQE